MLPTNLTDVDLNYRIDLPDAEVRAFLATRFDHQELENLLEFDQVRATIRNSNAEV